MVYYHAIIQSLPKNRELGRPSTFESAKTAEFWAVPEGKFAFLCHLQLSSIYLIKLISVDFLLWLETISALQQVYRNEET